LGVGMSRPSGVAVDETKIVEGNYMSVSAWKLFDDGSLLKQAAKFEENADARVEISLRRRVLFKRLRNGATKRGAASHYDQRWR
jgi:hypothetical protein